MNEEKDTYCVNDIVEGQIIQLESYGAFMDFPSGQKGLLHISELSNRFIRRLDLYLSKGDTLRVKVISIDPRNLYLRVSLKQVPEAIDLVSSSHRVTKIKVASSEIDFNPLKEALPTWIEMKLKTKEI